MLKNMQLDEKKMEIFIFFVFNALLEKKMPHVPQETYTTICSAHRFPC
jgi:hypothetical protein